MNAAVRSLVAAAALLGFGASLHAAPGARAEMADAQGGALGTVSFEETPTGVLLQIDLHDLPPGWHAIHLHSVGACAPDFKAAKGHVKGGAEAKHGLRSPEGPEAGDLPNIYVSADGRVRTEVYSTLVSLAGDIAPLLDDDGSAVVIHDRPDDHLSQPIGGAGGRIACGVIR